MRFLVISAVFVMTVGARRAEADQGMIGASDAAVAGVLIGGLVYVSGTLSMPIKDIVSSDHSLGYGIVETAFNGSAVIVWGVGCGLLADDGNAAEALATLPMIALHAGLLAHGIYTIVKRTQPADNEPPSVRVGPVTAVVSPAPMRDGVGLGISGTF